MKKRSITINFETDAPKAVVEEIAEHMRWQLDSLNDGTLAMPIEPDGPEVEIDEEYDNVKITVK